MDFLKEVSWPLTFSPEHKKKGEKKIFVREFGEIK